MYLSHWSVAFLAKLTSKHHVCESARFPSGEDLGRPVNWGHFLAHSELKVLGVGTSMYGFGRGTHFNP